MNESHDHPAHDVRAIADRYLDDLAEVDPAAAAALGHSTPVRIGPLDPGAYDARAEAARRALGGLQDAEPDNRPDQLLQSAMTERLGSDLALNDVGFTRGLLAPLATPVHLMRQVFDSLPSTTAEEVEVVLANLQRIPAALSEYRGTIQQTADRGYLVAQRQIRTVADQIQSWLDADYYGAVAGRCQQPALADEVTHAAAQASTASEQFAQWLREDLFHAARSSDPVGPEVYRITAGAFLGAHVEPEELYDWGWERIAELQRRERELARQISGSDDVAAATALLDADPARIIATGEPLREWLQTRLDDITDAVDGRWFDIPAATRAVEARIDTAASGVMYYTPMDAALTRPGRVWWTVPEGTKTVASWRQASTVHHEGVPGHHLQHAITHQLTHLHPWQRLLCHVHGYAEGWAHYAEHLAADIGLLDDPGDALGQVHAALWRACRVVVDIGLHLQLPVPEGKLSQREWTPELGVSMLHEVAGVDPQTAQFEVDRYLGWPGQALAFSVGSKLWHDARDAAGGERELRAFHAEALALGPMGLDPLRNALADLAIAESH